MHYWLQMKIKYKLFSTVTKFVFILNITLNSAWIKSFIFVLISLEKIVAIIKPQGIQNKQLTFLKKDNGSTDLKHWIFAPLDKRNNKVMFLDINNSILTELQKKYWFKTASEIMKDIYNLKLAIIRSVIWTSNSLWMAYF